MWTGYFQILNYVFIIVPHYSSHNFKHSDFTFCWNSAMVILAFLIGQKNTGVGFFLKKKPHKFHSQKSEMERGKISILDHALKKENYLSPNQKLIGTSTECFISAIWHFLLEITAFQKNSDCVSRFL